MKVKLEHKNEWITVEGSNKAILDVMRAIVHARNEETAVLKTPALKKTRTYTKRKSKRKRHWRPWTKSEENWLRINRARFNSPRLARELKRTVGAINQKTHEQRHSKGG